MLTRKYVRISDPSLLELTGCETVGALRGWIVRWNEAHPKERIHRMHGRVDLLSLERAVLEKERHGGSSTRLRTSSVDFRPCV